MPFPQIHLLVTGSPEAHCLAHSSPPPPPPHQVTAAFVMPGGRVDAGGSGAQGPFPQAGRAFPCPALLRDLPRTPPQGATAPRSYLALPADPRWGPLSSAGSIQLRTPQRASPPRQSSHLCCTSPLLTPGPAVGPPSSRAPPGPPLDPHITRASIPMCEGHGCCPPAKPALHIQPPLTSRRAKTWGL